MGGLAILALRKLIVSGNLPPNNVISHMESTGAHRCGRSSNAKVSADEAGDEESALVYDSGGLMVLQVKVEILKTIPGDTQPENKTGSRRQTLPRWKSGGKLGGSENARWLNRMTSSWLGPKCFAKERSDRTVRSRSTNVNLSLKYSGRSKGSAKDGKLRHFDAERAFLKAGVDEYMCIDIPDYQTFPGAVGLLNKKYGLVQAGRCWLKKFCDDRTAIGFEQSKAGSCMVSKVDGGEVEVVVVVHVDDNLAHSRGQATMERFAVELKRKFKLKDMDDDNYYARVPTLSKADGPQTPEVDEYMLKFSYREAVGVLMWTATMTRPDIVCVVRDGARFCENS